MLARLCPSEPDKLPGERYIRLLRIVEGNSDPVSVTVEPFSLEQLPPYEALSYTWGKALATGLEGDNEPEITHEILMNTKRISVTSNLYDGLIAMRNDVKGYLWIDSLCINQADIQERASQVLLMGDIYALAERVIVWLGDTIPQEMLKFLGITTDEWFNLWGNYGNFFSAYRWFSRAWVVQEILLPRDIILRCANITLPWDTIVTLAVAAMKFKVPLASIKATHFLRIVASRQRIIADNYMDAVLALNSGSQTAIEKWHVWLMLLVDIIRPQGVTCLHDKIYSIFGIARRSLPSTLDHANIARTLTVNYDQTIEDAYSSFAAEMLRNLPTLAFLSYVAPPALGIDSKVNNLPSWCPDFTTERSGVPFIGINSADGGDRIPSFMASKSLERENRPCEVNGRILSVSGKRVARVEYSGQATALIFDATIPFFEYPGCESLFDSCRQLEPVYSLTGEDRVEVLWRTLLLNNDSLPGLMLGGVPDAELYSSAFSSFVLVHSSVFLMTLEEDKADDFVSVVAQRTVDFKSSAIQLPDPSAIVEFAKVGLHDPFSPLHEEHQKLGNVFWLKAVQHGRKRLFTTAQKWLGYGPVNLKPNDEVWLLKNARVPFILRPRGESQYRLIGEAYVHGIMQGQLIDAPGGTDGFQEIEIV
ncbi:HET-domain-containing protein [Hyaloscypha variabilis F]|uniref:HET-domain-containing protein n=1 Tax=Hyaloscypha variabilis (strain UAMH 11265 / GT02V1 / F) TaxID=1149755 RepID=A0A2J6R714_HYAVF|nr:HET-domain-containing protein [Hyaloscypha variabilis F]